MKDYTKAKIYKITNLVNDKVYIGSTCDDLNLRLFNHFKTSCEYPERKFMAAINALQWFNFRIQLIEDFPCATEDELCSREAHYILEYNSINEGYNMILPKLSDEEKVAARSINYKKWFDKTYRQTYLF